jgi:hypothetical protein
MSPPAIFITIPYSAIESGTEFSEANNYGVNILIDSLAIKADTIVRFIKQFRHYFILSISGRVLANSNVNGLFPLLYSIFTLSSYRKDKNYIHIIYDSEDGSSSADELKKYFSLQGERNVEFTIHGKETVVEPNPEILISHFSTLKQSPEEFFEKGYTKKPQYIIFLFDQYKSINDNIKSLKLLTDSSIYLKIILELTKERHNALWLNYKSDLWKKRASLYFSFIPISKKVAESQYYDVLDWYKMEYEVLPLWYKRFGHILKVFKGKRSFKSLFGR